MMMAGTSPVTGSANSFMSASSDSYFLSNARMKVVTMILRFLSMRTPIVPSVTSFLPPLSLSNSIQAPRFGITVATYTGRPLVSVSARKYTPGERTSWLTITRSAPLIMNVPFSVMSGRSPMKISWSGMPLISPDSEVMSRTRTRSGAQ